jgi:protein SCO1
LRIQNINSVVILLTALFLALPVRDSGASSAKLTDGIFYEQRLGEQVLPTLEFIDDHGQTVRLGEYFRGRPLVLAMGYYRCPMLCGVVLNAVARTLEEFPPESVSRDFEFIFIGVDPNESFALAAEKKKECLRKLAWKPADSRWHFLVGKESAAPLAAQIGFHYRYDPKSKQYIHPSGLTILSPNGRITSYLLGIDYPASEFERALASARRGEKGVIGTIVSVLCFSNDHVPGTIGYYVMVSLRLGAFLTLVGLILIVRKKRPRLTDKLRET